MTTKIGPWNMWRGKRVRVFSGGSHRDLGVWEFIKRVTDSSGEFSTPMFKQGKRRIYGWSCWWIPESAHQREMRKRALLIALPGGDAWPPRSPRRG